MANKKVLITGGAGFIGANLVRKLISDGGFDVAVIEKDGADLWRLKDMVDSFKIVYVDLQDLKKLQGAVDEIKPDFVVHFAAYGVYSATQSDVQKMVDVNIKGTLNLAETLKNHAITAFINASSCGEYKAKNSSLNEEDPVDPSNAYHITKLAAELLLKKNAEKNNLPVINLRLFTPYGFYEDKQRLIPHIILNALNNKTIELSSPEYVRDFIFIEDLTDAFVAIIKSGKQFKGDIFNIGSGKQRSIQEVVAAVEKILGKKINVEYGKRKSYYDEPAFFEADITKASKTFSWKPGHTFEEGLKKTIDWLKEHNHYYA